MRCIHRHLRTHRALFGVHSQCIERAALHVIILHFWLLHSVAFVFRSWLFMLTYVHSRVVLACCTYLAFVCICPPPCIDSYTFQDGCIIYYNCAFIVHLHTF